MSTPGSLAAARVPAQLLGPDSRVSVAARTCLLEGPAFDADGSLYFSDIIGNRIYRMAPDGALSIFREDSGRTNGNTFDAHGRLISCEGAEFGPGGRRRVVRTDLEDRQDRSADRAISKESATTAPTTSWWMARGASGSPTRSTATIAAALEMTDEAVYRIDPDGTVARVLTQPQIERPNGLAVTPDDRTLYVIDSHTRMGGNRKVWAFDIATGRQRGRPAPGLRLRPRPRRRRHAAG